MSEKLLPLDLPFGNEFKLVFTIYDPLDITPVTGLFPFELSDSPPFISVGVVVSIVLEGRDDFSWELRARWGGS